MAGFFDVIKSSQYFLCFCSVASITCLKIFYFCGEFIIMILPSFAVKVVLILERRVESSLVILVLRILSISVVILPSCEERSSVILVLILFLILVTSAVIDVLNFISHA